MSHTQPLSALSSLAPTFSSAKLKDKNAYNFCSLKLHGPNLKQIFWFN